MLPEAVRAANHLRQLISSTFFISPGPEDFVLDLTVVRIAKIQGLFIMIKYATAVRGV